MTTDSMTSGWYYSKRGDPTGQRIGPLTWEQLYSLAQTGQLSSDDIVWNPQLPDWLLASQVPGLFPAAAAPAVQAPHPAPGQAGAVYQGRATQTAAPPSTARRRSSLYWVVPLVVLILVGAALGAYFGLRGGGNGSTGTKATWTNLNPSGDVPHKRSGQSMIYNPDTGKVILFGGCPGATLEGSTVTEQKYTAFNDTWAYDPAANTWTNLEPSGDVPSAREQYSMAYDSGTGKVIVFGGYDPKTGYGLADTWAYDPAANTWTNLNPSGDALGKRWGASMVYDPSSGKMILFGGPSGPSEIGGTWAYDPAANTWTNLKPSGDVPPATIFQSMIYDARDKKVILFGGIGADTWAYDPATNTWTNLNPSGDVPSARDAHTMVYDSANGRVILFGGDTGRTDTSVSPNDTWAYDPSANKWTERSPLGDVPSGRSDYSIAYDSGAGKVILFGGVGGDGFTLSDTWGYGATPLGGGSSAGTGITAAINETTSPTAGATTTTFAPTTTTTTAETTTTTAETTTTTAVLSQKWGVKAEVNGLRITVSVPATDKDVYATSNGVRDDTMKVIMAEVVLENIGSTPHVYYASDFTLYDTSDNSYFGDDEDSSGGLVGRPGLRSGYLQPGKKIYRWVAYIVPADAAASRIEYAEAEATDTQATWGYE